MSSEAWAVERARDLHFDLNGYEKTFVEAHGNRECNRCKAIAAALVEAREAGLEEVAILAAQGAFVGAFGQHLAIAVRALKAKP